MALTLFVSESYIKQYTPIGELVAWDELEPTVELSQDSFIQDVLGSNFYVYLQGVYIAQTLNASEIALMNLIKPALAYRVAADAVPFIAFQLKNKGVVTQSGDYSENADLTSIKYVRNELDNRAEFYSKRLSNYLCENASLFPQYINNNSTDMPPKSQGYSNCDLAFD